MPNNSVTPIKPKGRKFIFLLQLLESAADGVFLVGSGVIILAVLLPLIGVSVGVAVVASPLLYIAATLGILGCGAGAFYLRRLREKDRQQQLANALTEQKIEIKKILEELEQNNNDESKKNLIENVAKNLSAPGVDLQNLSPKKRAAVENNQRIKEGVITDYLTRYSQNLAPGRDELKRLLSRSLGSSITNTKKDVFTNIPSRNSEKTSSIIATGISEGRNIFTGVRDSVQIMATITIVLAGFGLGFLLGGPVGVGAVLLGLTMGTSIYFTMRNERKQNIKIAQIKKETSTLKEGFNTYKLEEQERNHLNALNLVNQNHVDALHAVNENHNRRVEKLSNKLNKKNEKITALEGKNTQLDEKVSGKKYKNLHMELKLQKLQAELKEKDAQLNEKDAKIAKKKSKIQALKSEKNNPNKEDKENNVNKENKGNKGNQNPDARNGRFLFEERGVVKRSSINDLRKQNLRNSSKAGFFGSKKTHEVLGRAGLITSSCELSY
ncbi:MAG: hypothetical protein HKM04_11670 [Legionellales bacterium]|nr:hypothetical protein [Legionellales bacterium]